MRTQICVVGSGTRFLSGISYYTHRVSCALAERHDVSVLLMRQLLPTRFYPGAARVGTRLHAFSYPANIPLYDGVDWSWWRSLPGALVFLRARKPKVVVLQWWTGAILHSYLVLAFVARLLGARVVIEFHEVQDVGELDVPLAGSYVTALFPVLLKMTDGYVVHSEFDRRLLHKRYRLGQRPVVLAPHGPYDRTNRGVSENPSAPALNAAGPMNLLYFGVIRPFKGVEDLIRAFEALDDQAASRFTLTIVGETWEGHDLPSQLIASSSRCDQIRFVNRYVSEQELEGFLAQADAVVLPYHRSSSSGPLATAMAHGLPVAVSAVGGLVEAARHYDGAVFFPPQDPEQLGRALTTLVGRRGQRYADPHSWADTVDGYDDLLRQLDHRGTRDLTA